MKNRTVNQPGQAMVEFALMIPIFILVIVGFFGMAVVFFSYIGASAAAHEGARWLVGHPQIPDSDVQTQICTVSPILLSTANCIARSEIKGNKNDCSTANPSIDMCIVIEPATRVQNTLVTVTVRYHTPVPTLSVSFLDQPGFTFLAPIWVESASTMRVEK